jgi:hypothetical protein
MEKLENELYMKTFITKYDKIQLLTDVPPLQDSELQ